MATGSNDPATLQPGRMFGYPVDSGTGCFMDHSAGQALFAKMNAEPDYFKFMMAEMDKTCRHTRSWLNLPIGDANVITFSSGDGDGLFLRELSPTDFTIMNLFRAAAPCR